MEKDHQQQNLEDEQARIAQRREQFEQERDVRAKERNRYRTIWQKLFGQEYTTGMDIAIEEALQMDAEIETLMQEGKAASTAEAVKVLEEEGKFGLKGQEMIGKEEWVRYRVLQFCGALEKNDFRKASRIIYQAQNEKNTDDEALQMLKKTITPFIIQKIAELLQNKDGKNFVQAFYTLGRLQPISAESFSQEDLHSPEIQDAVKESLIGLMSYDPEAFIYWRDEWKQAGIINAEEMDKQLGVQEIVKMKLINLMEHNPEAFIYWRNKWVREGIISTEEANGWVKKTES